MTSGAAQALYVALQASLGTIDWSHQTIINAAPAGMTAGSVGAIPVSIPALTTNQLVNLATLFPGLTNVQFISIQDITATPQVFSVGVGGAANVAIPASGFMAWTQNGGAPPTIQLSNALATAGNVLISVASL